MAMTGKLRALMVAGVFTFLLPLTARAQGLGFAGLPGGRQLPGIGGPGIGGQNFGGQGFGQNFGGNQVPGAGSMRGFGNRGMAGRPQTVNGMNNLTVVIRRYAFERRGRR